LDPDQAKPNVGFDMRFKLFDILILFLQNKEENMNTKTFEITLYHTQFTQHANRVAVVGQYDGN